MHSRSTSPRPAAVKGRFGIGLQHRRSGRTSRAARMANTAQLIEAICKIIRSSEIPIPITLMNHEVEEAASIIGGVVERCGHERVALTRVSIDPEPAAELGLTEGRVVEHGARPIIHCEPGLGRRARFEKD
jgi:hypothetical protein